MPLKVFECQVVLLDLILHEMKLLYFIVHQHTGVESIEKKQI